MIHSVQGVQGRNHPRVFTRSRWAKQGSTTKAKQITSGHSCKEADVSPIIKTIVKSHLF